LATAAFAIFDVDRDGFVTHSELCQVLQGLVGEHMEGQEVNDIASLAIQDADADEDGQLCFEEFTNVSRV
jgi:Ca2+-binding EF-hand superfamily protein